MLAKHGLGTKGPIGFADEMRVGLHGMVRRVWGRRGVKVRQRRQIVYEWRYLFLVVDGQRGRLFWCWMPTLNALETRGVIRGLQKASDLAGLVWDRAPAHTDHSVPKLGMPLVSLPPYDWDDPQARQEFLRAIVADADWLLEEARNALSGLPSDDAKRAVLVEAAELLGQILLQDIERHVEGAVLHEGVSPDRVVSVHDPQMRHGRKSATRRFDGHKEVIAVDPESQLIVAADVLPGNAQDHEQALDVVEQAEQNAAVVVDETIGDCAFGDGQTRQEFAEANRTLIAKVPQRRDQAFFPKDDFQIDLQAMTCTCPADHTTQDVISIGSGKRYGAPDAPLRAFRFDAALCDVCPLRPSCVRARLGRGRLVMLHPREALLQEARAFQKSLAFAPYRQLRQVAEHRLARLMQLGMRQARCFGRQKTRFQLFLAATVANLTLVATKLGMMGKEGNRDHFPHRAFLTAIACSLTHAILTMVPARSFRSPAVVYR